MLTAFASSLCNCTELCISVNIVSCLNVSVAISELTLQGSKALESYNTLITLLQRVDLRIQDSTYFLTCLDPWCNAENVTNDVVPTVLETSSESNCNIEIFIICLLVILVSLNVAMAIKCYSKPNNNTSCFNAISNKDRQQHYFALSNLKQTV